MLIPRRVRRRLLLPPGWVALGFLLLLGCLALRPWAGRARLWNVVQLTMPPLKADTSYLRFLSEPTKRKEGKEYNPYSTPWSKSAATALRLMRPWHDVEFTGVYLADFFSATATESAVRQIIADTSHAGGVRIRFLKNSTYSNLVKVLDIMNCTKQKKYWLDIRHDSTTLYAITTLPIHLKQAPIFSCGTINRETQLLQKMTALQLAAELKELISLKNQAWRLPIILLIVLSSLGLRRLLQVAT